jgi:hypothetical protein
LAAQNHVGLAHAEPYFAIKELNAFRDAGAGMEVETLEHHAFTSVKGFILHILTISLGISLALAGEAALEYRHHRELVAETREAFHNQIDDNRKAVTENLKALADTQARLQNVLTLVDTDFVAARQAAISARHAFIDLDTDSWDPAVTTGALTYMNLGEVRQYSKIHVAELALNKLSHEDEDSWFQLAEYNAEASELDANDRKAVKKLIRKAAAYAKWIAVREQELLKMYDQVAK